MQGLDWFTQNEPAAREGARAVEIGIKNGSLRPR
jgi:hypothetical protein